MPVGLPKIVAVETADELQFDCPQPWYLLLFTAGMTVVSSSAVVGAFFFLLADPEQVTPKCWQWGPGFYQTCTFSAVCFWTYPVVCCMFVVVVYCKNMLDTRLYYECLLHKVIVRFEKKLPFEYPTVIVLLAYAALAMSSILWHSRSEEHKGKQYVNFAYVYMAYIMPVFSFLAVVLTRWSITSQLITVPDFLMNFKWGLSHLQGCRAWNFWTLRSAYNDLEDALNSTEGTITTPQMVSLIAHYAGKDIAEGLENEDENGGSAVGEVKSRGLEDGVSEEESGMRAAYLNAMKAQKSIHDGLRMTAQLTQHEAERSLLNPNLYRKYIYWPLRMLFNTKIQDSRSRSFRRWLVGYICFVLFIVILGTWIFTCCVVSALKLEQVIDYNSWVAKFFSLSESASAEHAIEDTVQGAEHGAHMAAAMSNQALQATAMAGRAAINGLRATASSFAMLHPGMAPH